MQPKWLGLYRVEQHRTNENYLIREVGTHHTQLVHRIRLRPYQPQATVEDLRQIDKTKFKSDPKFPEQYREPAVFDDARERLRRHPEDPLEDAETAPEPVVEQRVTRSRKYTLLSADPTAVITTGRGRAPGAPPIADPPRMLPVPMPPVYGPPKTIPQPPRIDRTERVCRSQARQVNDLQNHPALAARHDIPLEEPDPEARLAPPKRRIVLPRRHSEMVPGNAPQRNLDDQLQILPHQWERFGGEPIPKMTHTVQRQQVLTRPTTCCQQEYGKIYEDQPSGAQAEEKETCSACTNETTTHHYAATRADGPEYSTTTTGPANAEIRTRRNGSGNSQAEEHHTKMQKPNLGGVTEIAETPREKESNFGPDYANRKSAADQGRTSISRAEGEHTYTPTEDQKPRNDSCSSGDPSTKNTSREKTPCDAYKNGHPSGSGGCQGRTNDQAEDRYS